MVSRWAVTVSVGGTVVRAYSVVATSRDAAIGKARRKLRGAVSSAGAFVYDATEVGAVKLGH